MSSQRRLAGSPLPQALRDRLESVAENVRILQRQVQGDSSTSSPSPPSLSPSEFPAHLQQGALAVSHSCTAMAVLFSKPPPPSLQDCGVLCGRVEQTTLHLAATYFQFQPSRGKMLHGEVRSSVLNILSRVGVLVEALIQNGCSGGSARLRGAGSVWESCEAIPSVSKDNRSAVLRVFIAQLHLLKDACSEMEGLRACNGFSDDGDVTLDRELDLAPGLENKIAHISLREGGDLRIAGTVTPGLNGSVEIGGEEEEEEEVREWTDREKQLAEPCMRLIELCADLTGAVSRLVVTGGGVREAQDVRELDSAAVCVQQLSPLVDDLGDELSAPINSDKCRDLASRLGKTLLSFTDLLSGCQFCVSTGWDADKHRKSISELLHQISIS